MLNDKSASIMSYTIKQSYSDDTQSEFEVYNEDNQRIGYYVTDITADCIEVYSNPSDDFDDYFRIEYADDAEDAFDIIVTNYEYA